LNVIFTEREREREKKIAFSLLAGNTECGKSGDKRGLWEKSRGKVDVSANV
jgi:hypothetical protein